MYYRGECPNVTEVPDLTRDRLGTFGTNVPYPPITEVARQLGVSTSAISKAIMRGMKG